MGICKVKKYEFSKPTTNYLVLDNIQDPSNLGAIIRTAVATNFLTMYLIDCVDEYNEKVIRASMGNLFRCKFIHIALDQVKEFCNDLYICDMNGKDIFKNKDFPKILGLCIGNEGHGVNPKIRENIKNVISKGLSIISATSATMI